MKGYRTIAFNIIMPIVLIVSMWSGDTDTAAPTEQDITAALDAIDTAIASIWAIGNWILRAITDTPMFKGK